MLDQILAGNPVALGLAGWAAYGPALAFGLVALVMLALPGLRNRPTTARRPDQVVVRAHDDVGIAAYLPGLILGAIAAALAYYGARPHVVIAADSLTCRPWTRPLQMSEIRGISVGETGRPARPAVALDIVFAGEMRRGGVMTRIEEIAIAALRGPSGLVARERGRGEGTCPLGGLSIDGREAAALIQIAWGRAALGRLPDGASAIEAFCASPPTRLQANCVELVRRGIEQCRGSDAAGLSCRYQIAMSGRAPASPAAAPTATPPAVRPPAPAPGSPPASPPATPPTATPAPPRPAPPPTATPPPPPAPARPSVPPATPPAGPGKPSAPGTPPPGKPS